MCAYSHEFVKAYKGLMGLGLDRKTDEATVTVYLQRFSDDALMQILRSRLSDKELEEIFELTSRLLKKYLTDDEYHKYFLKD